MSAVLVLLIVVPLLSAIGVAVLGQQRAPTVRWVSLGSTLLSFVLAFAITSDYAGSRPDKPAPLKKFEPSYATDIELIPLSTVSGESGVIRFHIGIDGLSVWLVALTALLMVCAVASSWTAVTDRVNEYYAWMLVLQMAMTGVFLSMDVVLFYVFFELTLIPLFFLIGIWGGPQRQYAARKFFVFTLAGSLITLLGVLGVVLVFATSGYTDLERDANGMVKVDTKGEVEVKSIRKLTVSIPELIELGELAQKGAKECEERLARGQVKEQQKPRIRTKEYWQTVQFWVFAAMMVGFAVKVPLVPVHTWLPLAHTEAPTAGSVLLAGVLLKLGTYGFLRLCLPLTPDACVSFGAPFIGSLAVFGVIYGAFCALRQDDIKKMVAYSSVSHLGLCMIGLFALNEVGMMGSLLQMINHGLSTGALFLLVGMLYERYHTRKIDDYSGMAAKMKLLGVAFVFMTMSSIGLPGLNGFVGEITAMMGMFAADKRLPIDGRLLAALAATGVILGAWYMLTLTMRVFFGPLKEPHHTGHAVHDLNAREVATLAPIAIVCLIIGLYSPCVTKVAEPEIKYVADLQRKAMERQ